MIREHNVSEKNEKEWKKEKRRFSFQQDDKGERCAHVYALSKLEIKKITSLFQEKATHINDHQRY